MFGRDSRVTEEESQPFKRHETERKGNFFPKKAMLFSAMLEFVLLCKDMCILYLREKKGVREREGVCVCKCVCVNRMNKRSEKF